MEGRVRNELTGMIDDALGDDAKLALIAARRLKTEVDWLTERAVALARRNGYDWGRISRLLGITRQWARKRFKDAPPRLPPHVVNRDRYLAEQRRGERLLNQINSRTYRSADDGDDETGVVPW